MDRRLSAAEERGLRNGIPVPLPPTPDGLPRAWIAPNVVAVSSPDPGRLVRVVDLLLNAARRRQATEQAHYAGEHAARAEKSCHLCEGEAHQAGRHEGLSGADRCWRCLIDEHLAGKHKGRSYECRLCGHERQWADTKREELALRRREVEEAAQQGKPAPTYSSMRYGGDSEILATWFLDGANTNEWELGEALRSVPADAWPTVAGRLAVPLADDARRLGDRRDARTERHAVDKKERLVREETQRRRWLARDYGDWDDEPAASSSAGPAARRSAGAPPTSLPGPTKGVTWERMHADFMRDWPPDRPWAVGEGAGAVFFAGPVSGRRAARAVEEHDREVRVTGKWATGKAGSVTLRFDSDGTRWVVKERHPAPT